MMCQEQTFILYSLSKFLHFCIFVNNRCLKLKTQSIIYFSVSKTIQISFCFTRLTPLKQFMTIKNHKQGFPDKLVYSTHYIHCCGDVKLYLRFLQDCIQRFHNQLDQRDPSNVFLLDIMNMLTLLHCCICLKEKDAMNK